MEEDKLRTVLGMVSVNKKEAFENKTRPELLSEAGVLMGKDGGRLRFEKACLQVRATETMRALDHDGDGVLEL